MVYCRESGVLLRGRRGLESGRWPRPLLKLFAGDFYHFASVSFSGNFYYFVCYGRAIKESHFSEVLCLSIRWRIRFWTHKRSIILVIFVCGVVHFLKSPLLYPTVALQLVREFLQCDGPYSGHLAKFFFLQITRQPGCENLIDTHTCFQSSHGYQLNTAAWFCWTENCELLLAKPKLLWDDHHFGAGEPS